ncbi:MAG: PEP-CTERM sorting domain-containing protein [Deltaproteobacteria bacterium]|nr:PEP-CTERM sorting domain-containing protein [Deltaproteobacteria bacterium]
MKKCYLILLQIILSVFLISSIGFAAPNLDGHFHKAEWTYDNTAFSSVTIGGTQTTPRYENAKSGFTADPDQFFVNGVGRVGPGGGGDDYDAKYLGLFIDDNYLYFGLKTGFDLENGQGNIKAGDIAIDFSKTLNDAPDFDFGIDLSDHSPSLTKLYEVDGWTHSGHPAKSDPFQIDFSKTTTHLATESYSNGSNTDFYAFYRPGSSDVIEGKIKLSLLQQKLTDIDLDGTSGYYATLHWTMGCGNDFLNKTIQYTPTPGSEVPEPATLILFGMGLIGASAFGRKKFKKENV